MKHLSILRYLAGSALCLLAASALASAPQPDTFQSGLASFWKQQQTVNLSDLGAYPAPVASASGGVLTLDSADADSDTLFEPYLVYQDGVTGSFSLRLHVTSIPACSPSSAAFLMIAQGLPGMVATTNDIPVWALVDASRDDGTEFKYGSIGHTTAFNIMAGLAPPYWIRLDKIGNLVTAYNSTDGANWNPVGPAADLTALAPGLTEPFIAGIGERTHCGATAGTSTVGPFQVIDYGQGNNTPGAITDLAASDTTTTGTTLTFTAPGDNGLTGMPAAYDVRQSAQPITADNFDMATSIASPAPGAPFSKVSIPVTGLAPLHDYYFAVQTTSTSLKTSLSNVLQLTSLAPAGDGLLGSYYPWDDPNQGYVLGNTDKDTRAMPLFTRVDPTINFAWFGTDPPAPGMPGQRFDVTWTGYVVADTTGDYTFLISAGEGGRLWVGQVTDNDTPVIDQWQTPSTTPMATDTPIHLVAGTPVAIRFDYYASSGPRVAALYWKSSKLRQQIIPQANLRSSATAQPDGLVTGFAYGADGKPLAGVSLQLGGPPVTTGTDGRFSFVAPAGPQAPTLPDFWALAPNNAAPVINVGSSQIANNVVVQFPLEVVSLKSKNVTKFGSDGWHFLQTGPDDVSTVDGSVDTYGATDYKDTGADAIVPTSKWLAPWNYVPNGFNGVAVGASAPPWGILANSDWVQRVHVTLPSVFLKGTSFELGGFNMDDNNRGTYVNGTNVGMGSGWTLRYNFPVPASAITSNMGLAVVTMIGNKVGGGPAAQDLNYSGPWLAAAIPAASVVAPMATPAALCGDLNGSGTVTVADATLALRIGVGLATASATNTAGACGHPITVAFATQILRAAVFGATINPQMQP